MNDSLLAPVLRLLAGAAAVWWVGTAFLHACHRQAVPMLGAAEIVASGATPTDGRLKIFLPVAMQRRDTHIVTATPPGSVSPTPLATATGTGAPTENAYANCEVTETFDANDDGAADRLTHFVYNGAGRIARQQIDHGADGAIDSTQIRNYSADGLLLERLWYAGISKQLTRLYQYEYDADQRQSLWRLDLDGDGTFDRFYYYSYRATGELLAIKQDRDGDDDIDQVCRYRIPLDAGTFRNECDDDNDGDMDRSERVTYDAGRVIEVRYDDNDDGSIERVVTYGYNAAGLLAYEGTDGDADGVDEDWEEYDYDERGLLSETRVYRGGALEHTILDEYDQRGRLLQRYFVNVFYANAVLSYTIRCGSR